MIKTLVKMKLILLVTNMSSKIFAIIGPTASGKSEVGKILVGQGYSVCNFDSCQLFSGLPVLKAVPDHLYEHYLYQIFHHNERKTVVDWCLSCEKVVENIWNNNRIPVLIGGTGFYLKSLIEGVINLPVISSFIENYVRQLTKDEVVDLLEKYDPLSLKFQDERRLKKSLKIYLETNKSIFDYHSQRVSFNVKNIHVLALLPDCDFIKRFIKKRLLVNFEKMVKEVEENYDSCYELVIGFKEIKMFLDREINRSQCIDLIFFRTCQYAKRQRTYITNCLLLERVFKDSKSLLEYIIG